MSESDEDLDALFETQDDDESIALYEHHHIVVDNGQSMVRIDKFLFDKLPNVSRSKVQVAIDQGFVTVNDQPTRSNYKVRAADVIRISLPEPPRLQTIEPEPIPLDIVYEDDDIMVIHKPAGLVVHPAYNNWQGTLVNGLLFHFQQLPTREGSYPGLVHRIDKDTSGLLVIGKTTSALQHLGEQFRAHSIERTYWALVWGTPEPPEGTIHTMLGRSAKDRRITEVFPLDNPFGKEAITHYKTLQDLHYVALIQCNLETGRTHQIRAHLKHLGHPLFGDTTYGGDRILKGTVFNKYRDFVMNCFKLLPRQALHAKSLGFVHPTTGKKMFFDSKLPTDFQAVLDKWTNYLKYRN
jgi:23S rRNA pseudouridine1911/1915/1917 synthase